MTRVENSENIEKLNVLCAINAKDVEVKFSQKVREADVITANKLNTTNITMTSVETPQKPLNASDVDAELSEDGKNDKLEEITKYDEIVNLGKDTVAPTVKSVEVVNASTTKVTFSEPIKTLGNFTFKLADGTVVSAADMEIPAQSTDEFDVFLDGVKYNGAETATTAAITADNKVVITLSAALDVTDLAKAITVKKGSSNTVADIATNSLDLTSTTVAK